MPENKLEVIKQDGEAVTFDDSKLRQSLKNAHAPDDVIEDIVSDIKESAEGEITTEEIYKRAYKLLKEYRRSYAAQYSLRESLAELGPTGYPFESFVARVFAAKGYETDVGVALDGKCTEHEVDVVAQKNDTVAFVEVKFHNDRSIKSSLHTPMYTRARFNDLADNNYDDYAIANRDVEHWIVTNTKFSGQAIEYGECAGLQMISWNHPENNNLQKLITNADLQPVTALTSLNGAHKRELTKQNLVLCKNLRHEKEKLRDLGFSGEEIDEVIDEVDHLCHV